MEKQHCEDFTSLEKDYMKAHLKGISDKWK